MFALVELDLPLLEKLRVNNLTDAVMLECDALPAMAQMWRTGLHWNAENLQQRKLDYEYDIKGLAQEFIEKLDAALPEEHQLPRDEDGAFNLRAKEQGKLSDGTKTYAGININSPKQHTAKIATVAGKIPKAATGHTRHSRHAFRASAV